MLHSHLLHLTDPCSSFVVEDPIRVRPTEHGDSRQSSSRLHRQSCRPGQRCLDRSTKGPIFSITRVGVYVASPKREMNLASLKKILRVSRDLALNKIRLSDIPRTILPQTTKKKKLIIGLGPGPRRDNQPNHYTYSCLYIPYAGAPCGFFKSQT